MNNKVVTKTSNTSKYNRKNHYDLLLPPIPERWENYKPFGKIVEGTRIICFKVPIRDKFQQNSSSDIWDIRTLLKAIPKLGAVIDLTNTNRYYKAGELKSRGIVYKKIFVQGQHIPAEDKVKRFIDAVDSFTDKTKLIGVHCTHGLNRTGYMVCRYLKDRCHIPAREAIKRFERARGYRIERENYIADLLGKVIEIEDKNFDSEKELSNGKIVNKIVKKNITKREKDAPKVL